MKTQEPVELHVVVMAEYAIDFQHNTHFRKKEEHVCRS